MAGLSLRQLADGLNFTDADGWSYAWLRKYRHGPALSALAKSYGLGAWQMLHRVGVFCHWSGSGSRAFCPAVLNCVVKPLQEALLAFNTQLQRGARGVVRHLCKAGASGALVALVAAVDSQATHYPSVTTECITLGGALDTWLDGRPLHEGGCGEGLHDVGVQCAHSLFQAAHLSAGAFWDFLRLVESTGWATYSSRWVYVGVWGSRRVDILGGLLEASLHERLQQLGSTDASSTSTKLRMAEVGVFQANTSRSLLERFSTLHMLLVDPYHLHTEDAESEHQQIQEFYVSSREIFDKATAWTSDFRTRATHIVQASGQAAAWVKKNSLDMVFIDGDHRFDSVQRDMLAWWPTLRPGGILAGHDFVLTFPGVVEAATKFALANDLRLFFAPEIWWIAKPAEVQPAGMPSPWSYADKELQGVWFDRGVKHIGSCVLSDAAW
eukprot:TRINITY_DN125730_c0_g1_i1.p1 TRINITY_DN125730_c0_g1~~TRINITY_DN125730_c0_g1_i1.p1  ORF type:complete len:439 (+),score=80.14 TRINITY_DN125730_c0_g1_i1:85-1401(+)